MKVKTYHSRALIAWLAAAVLAASLMTLVGTKPAWTADRNFELAPNNPFSVGDAPTTVTSADFNADSKVDLAAQNAGSDNVSVRLGKGDGDFQDKQDFTTGLTPTSVISADFNADTFADLAVANQDSNSVSVLLGRDLNGDGKGDGDFQDKQDSPAGLKPSSVISADFNGDQKADLAVANQNSDDISVLLGKGDGTFQSAQNSKIAPPCSSVPCLVRPIAAPNQVIAVDFNGDNKADLATASVGRVINDPIFGAFSNPGGVTVLLGKGDGTFQTPREVLRVDNSDPVLSITSAQLDAGSSVDLVATKATSNVVSVLKGNGDGTFQAAQNIGVGVNPSAVTSADLDGDAKVDDLAVSNYSSGSVGNVSVLFNNDSGGFQAARTFPAGNGPAFVTGAAFNADSFADLAVANQNSDNVSVLLNSPRADTTAPITTRSLSPQPNAAGWNNKDATVTLSATDDDSGVKEISYSMNGGQLTTVQQNSFQIPPITKEGEATISYYATDNANNVEAQQTFKVKLDKSAPSAPVITSPPNNSFDTDGTIAISGTAEANSTAEVFEATASGDISKGTIPVDASGTWTKTLSGLSNGSRAYKAKAKDAADNTSGFSNSRTIIVDKVKPIVTSTTPLAGATNVGLGTNLTATFSEKMMASSIITPATTFKLYRIKSDGTQTQITNVAVSLSSDGLKATLDPFGAQTTTKLARNTKYKGVVTTGAMDLAGNSLAQQKSWTFKTRS